MCSKVSNTVEGYHMYISVTTKKQMLVHYSTELNILFAFTSFPLKPFYVPRLLHDIT